MNKRFVTDSKKARGSTIQINFDFSFFGTGL